MRNLLNRWWLGKEDAIAVDAQESRLIVAVRALKESGALRVRSMPLSDSLSMEIQGDSFASAEEVIGALRECLVDCDPRYARLGVSLPTHSTLRANYPEDLDRPFSDLKRVQEWASCVLALTEVDYQLRIIPYEVNAIHERCVVLATKRGVVEFWESVAGALGVELVRIVPRGCALNHTSTKRDRGDCLNSIIVIDMTEREPCIHTFCSSMLVDSTVVSDAGCEANVLRDSDGKRGWDLIEGAKGSAVRIRCVLSKHQTPEQARLSPRLHSLLSGEVEWLFDESVAARGVLAMIEE